MDDGQAIFASRTLLEHFIRGFIAAGLLAWIFLHQSAHPFLTAAAAIAALIAMRGCPFCWMMGLVETVMHTRRPGAPRCDC